jgi:hypothetical protein
LPVDAVMKAKDELIRPENHCIAKSSTRIRIFFNSEMAMVLPIPEKNLAAASVTETRTEK